MAIIGIFFGSDTGNTENIAKMIQENLAALILLKFMILLKAVKRILKHLIFYYSVFLPGIMVKHSVIGTISFRHWKKLILKVSWWLFWLWRSRGLCGIFCDAMGTVKEIIESNGASIIGHWPTEGYHFEASKGLADDTHFIGLAIDEDRQPELTDERVQNWVKQISDELELPAIIHR